MFFFKSDKIVTYVYNSRTLNATDGLRVCCSVAYSGICLGVHS